MGGGNAFLGCGVSYLSCMRTANTNGQQKRQERKTHDGSFVRTQRCPKPPPAWLQAPKHQQQTRTNQPTNSNNSTTTPPSPATTKQRQRNQLANERRRHHHMLASSLARTYARTSASSLRYQNRKLATSSLSHARLMRSSASCDNPPPVPPPLPPCAFAAEDEVCFRSEQGKPTEQQEWGHHR